MQEDYTGVIDVPAAEDTQVEAHEEQQEIEAVEAPQEEVTEQSSKELNFKALREEIAREKVEREAERQRYNQELESLRYQVNRPQNNPDQVKSYSELEGDSDEDLLTVGKYRRAIKEQQEMFQKQEAAYKLRLSELEVKMRNPDYDEVMEKYSIPLLHKDKDLAQALQASGDPAAFAYNIGKKEMLMKQYQEQLATLQGSQKEQDLSGSQKAQRIVENARKPQTLSSARGGQPSLSKADYYASMSDEEFAKYASKNME
jgi:hypothetical protein